MSVVTRNEILLDTASRAWRRRVGALAWAVLEELALAAHSTSEGWVAPIGVRDLAARIGITKDTAARAVATLRSEGLVTLDRVQRPDGHSRSGYRIGLPPGIELRIRPDDHDNRQPATPTPHCPQPEDAHCPEGEYTPCPDEEYRPCPECEYEDNPPPARAIASIPPAAPASANDQRDPRSRRKDRVLLERSMQPTLFPPTDPGFV
jgi:hypothetical protein